jgi:hypothetical protein
MSTYFDKYSSNFSKSTKLVLLFLILILFSCKDQIVETKIVAPQKTRSWLNPIFYNNDFETEYNFPFWFDDSLIKSHSIRKITKRIFRGEEKDSNGHAMIPKEKIEYYFDPNGHVDELIRYNYIDDREVSRSSFVFYGNFTNDGYRKVKNQSNFTINKMKNDEFSVDSKAENKNEASLYEFERKKKKFVIFTNKDSKEQLFIVPLNQYWGSLSIDSILKPDKKDWIVQGYIRKPNKRYKVENMVKENSIYNFYYWDNSVIKTRIKEFYPFVYKRDFLYLQNGKWIGYSDSTYSEDTYINHSTHELIFDQFERPHQFIHTIYQNDTKTSFYKETFHYQTLK